MNLSVTTAAGGINIEAFSLYIFLQSYTIFQSIARITEIILFVAERVRRLTLSERERESAYAEIPSA